MSKKRTKDVKAYPPVTCGDRNGCKCEKHNKPCNIAVDFHPKDSRRAWVAELHALGAESHKATDTHRCVQCEDERRMNTPWRFVRVPGTVNAPGSIPAEQIAEEERRRSGDKVWF